MSKDLYIGLISGTSMDAVDCVLIEIINGLPQVLHSHNKALPPELLSDLSALCSNKADLQCLGSTDVSVAQLFAQAALELLELNKVLASDIKAIGSHGQTIWHEPPQRASEHPFSLQIGDPNTIAEITGITTIADFRRRDMAAGGQGAPLVPALHQALFQDDETDRIVLNLGGMANITLLPKSGDQAIGLDTGPANVLMDHWVRLHKQQAFDTAGEWAASAIPSPELLALMLDEAYFQLPSPKSTGRELFNPTWLQQKLETANKEFSPSVVQASLLELSSETISREIEKLVSSGEILVCGGGVRNKALISRLQSRLPKFSIQSTTDLGLDADFVEATAFAWFASITLQGKRINFAPFTGAKYPVPAGGIYFA